MFIHIRSISRIAIRRLTRDFGIVIPYYERLKNNRFKNLPRETFDEYGRLDIVGKYTILIYKNGTLRHLASDIKEAEDWIGCSRNHLYKVFKREDKHCKGYEVALVNKKDLYI